MKQKTDLLYQFSVRVPRPNLKLDLKAQTSKAHIGGYLINLSCFPETSPLRMFHNSYKQKRNTLPLTLNLTAQLKSTKKSNNYVAVNLILVANTRLSLFLPGVPRITDLVP